MHTGNTKGAPGLAFETWDPPSKGRYNSRNIYVGNSRISPFAFGLSRTLLSTALTKVRLLLYGWNAGGKLAYPLCGTRYDAAPLLYPYSWGKTAPILPRRNSNRRMLQASILTNFVSPVSSVMITVSRLGMRDPSAKCADSPRDVQSPFQLPMLGPLRLHLCPA
jgi:hypothetical protein